MGRLDGKVALITGGARGQGRAHAVRLAEEGASIIVTDIATDFDSVPYPMATAQDLEETVALVEALDQRCLGVLADARSLAQTRDVVTRSIAEFGKIDILVVNHGIAPPCRWDAPEQVCHDVVDVNLKGAFLTCQAVIPHLIERGDGGSIVLTSSVAGLQSFHNMAVYVMAKHGVTGLMRALSADLAPYRIRVNAICPGMVDTPMVMNEPVLSMFSGKATGGTREEAAFTGRTMNLLPEPWLADRDIANALLWLVSDDARYVTGIAVPVDLGMCNQPAGIPLPGWQALAAAREGAQ
jgi:SDR family mycofactocin-dependent oxidoreductase